VHVEEMMTHTKKTMHDRTPIVGTIQVICEGADGITALVDGKRQTFPNLRAVFVAAVHLLEKHPKGGAHAIQRELLPVDRSIP
jgi:hypothetical protein